MSSSIQTFLPSIDDRAIASCGLTRSYQQRSTYAMGDPGGTTKAAAGVLVCCPIGSERVSEAEGKP